MTAVYNGLPSSQHAIDDCDQPAKRMRFNKCPAQKPIAQPLGNLLFHIDAHDSRDSGLGHSFSQLPDELVSAVFSELEPHDWLRAQATSRAFFAWSRIESHWKLAYVKRSRGGLQDWRGSWRSSYVYTFIAPHSYRHHSRLPSDSIDVSGSIYSDVLSLPYLAAKYDANVLVKAQSFANNIPRKDGRGLTAGDLGDTPMILTHLIDDWKAASGETASWSLPSIAARYPSIKFRAEAVLTTMDEYISYHNASDADESPLYVFDPDFVDKTRNGDDRGGLEDDFNVPHLFADDLFKLLGKQRPNYRWLIAGPARSGSTFHLDPNATSAWNAVVTGRKLWICFPPDITPPGIHVSDDMSEVEAPLSLAEWLFNFYPQAKSMYGPRAKDPLNRGKMLEGVCEQGETFYVPAGWWHLVVNLESSIAVTQNFVSQTNLPGVLYFLKHRAEQVSGFRMSQETSCLAPTATAKLAQDLGNNHAHTEYGGEEDDESGGLPGVVFEQFCNALRQHDSDLLMDGLKGMARLELHRQSVCKGQQTEGHDLWTRVTAPEHEHKTGSGDAGFSFGFDIAAMDEWERNED